MSSVLRSSRVCTGTYQLSRAICALLRVCLLLVITERFTRFRFPALQCHDAVRVLLAVLYKALYLANLCHLSTS